MSINKIHNTFGIEAYAKRYVEYTSEEELISIIPSLTNEQSILHVGGGSNLLFTKDFDGLVLHSGIKGIELLNDGSEDDEHVKVRVGAGVIWDDFVDWAVNSDLYGAENLSLIPGEVGASAVQNIGAYGVEAKDLIVKVECVDIRSGEKVCFNNVDCHYSYRQSIFKNELKGKYAVTYVTYKLSRIFHPQLEYGNIRTYLSNVEDVDARTVRRAIIDIRNAKLPDPNIQGNAGSFFMNPVVSLQKFHELQNEYPQMPFYEVEGGVKIPAGWMIEQCGWKGKSMGKAAVHDKQALVLVNLGGASGSDILQLCEAVRQSVKTKFGIDIHPEVNVI